MCLYRYVSHAYNLDSAADRVGNRRKLSISSAMCSAIQSSSDSPFASTNLALLANDLICCLNSSLRSDIGMQDANADI